MLALHHPLASRAKWKHAVTEPEVDFVPEEWGKDSLRK